MNISYEYYKTFYYVAKYKSLTIAAKELNNNQPNVSRIVKLLEHELGCKLFVRKSHGIELTKEGEKLFFYVANAVKQFDTAESEMEFIAKSANESITVGVSENAAYMVLLPALEEFRKNHPEIKVKILNNNANTSIDLVKQGLVDFAVASSFGLRDDNLISTKILEYSDHLYGGPSYRNVREPMDLEEVSRQPIVSLSSNSVTYEFYRRLFEKNKLEFNPLYEVETAGQLCPMLMYDLGVAFIPELYTQNSLRNKTIFEIKLKEPVPPRGICIIENKSKRENMAAEKLKEYCMKSRDYMSF